MIGNAQARLISLNSVPSNLTPNTLAIIIAIAFVISLISMPLAQAQTFTVLHEFGSPGDGAEPSSGVVVDPFGNIYGVTLNGGSFNYGIVFSLDAAGNESVLHNFLGGEGLSPDGGLFLDGAGHIYGTTGGGGIPENGGCAHGCGTVFKRDAAGIQTELYAFTGTTDGGAPDAALVRDAARNFYGTGSIGGEQFCYGVFGCGVIFKLDTANQESVLYSFTDGTDGKFPHGLVADAAGNLYGATYDGGTYGKGGVFEVDQAGTLTVLHSFTGGADSDNPTGFLVRDEAGNLYGTTNSGLFNAEGFGIVYKLEPSGKLKVLHSFTEAADGEYPNSLVRDVAGNLYGVTLGGGTSSGCYYGSCGTVFKLDSGGNKMVLHNFTGSDGQLPNSLTTDKTGNLYGTTLGGGKGSQCAYYKGCGVVFKLMF
jgi:uncharacterized repeat protein (TIGR03803 family)